ncbi:MAG: hypothetical protein HQL56_17520 [Magnetococcales bacterium]|nr:hypothetical protein [Magnetococcales bacterium]
MAKELSRLELELHPDKTRVVRSCPQVQFLGRKMPIRPVLLPTPPVRR